LQVALVLVQIVLAVAVEVAALVQEAQSLIILDNLQVTAAQDLKHKF
jgi:hypothetical protein